MAGKGGVTIVIKKKKGGGHGGHHGGAWKVAYADFVTAMMAFFLVMWLMGSDEETKAAVAGHFNGGPNPKDTLIRVSPESPKGGQQLEDFSDTARVGGRPIDMPMGRTDSDLTRESDLLDIKEQLDESMSLQLGLTSESSVKLDTYIDSRGLVLRIVASDFFERGKSEIAPDMFPVINKVGAILSAYKKRMIRVEGHTEPTESVDGDNSASWRLSTERAQSVVQYWLQRNVQFDPRRIQIAGASHNRSIASNSDENGRAVNRRVEITVLQTSIEGGN